MGSLEGGGALRGIELSCGLAMQSKFGECVSSTGQKETRRPFGHFGLHPNSDDEEQHQAADVMVVL